MELNARNRYLLATLWDYKVYLLAPVIAGMFLSLVYVMVFRTQSWTSRQRLMVRDDLLGQSFKPGQFSSFDTMKSRQETILDIARNPDVIRAALQEIGPATQGWFFDADNYPDNRTIEQLQGQINLSAPNGAEFGTTEVVVLSVKAPSSERSSTLISKLLTEIEKQIEQVRIAQLKSMEYELTAARDNARASLLESIEQLRQMEMTLGPDSVAMANMTSTMPGDNSIKSETLQIQGEKRGFEARLESLRSSQRTLEEARANPLLIVSSAASFFRDQTKVAELAKSLVDSQKSYAIAAGKYQEAHPLVQHAAEQLVMMKHQVASELLALNNSLDTQIHELEQQLARLDQQIEFNHQRLMKLSEKRGEHLAINSEIAKRTEVLNQYEANLKNVQSYVQGSGNNVWINRMGDPQSASQPDGLSKRATVLAGGFLGLLFGLGLVVLLAPSYSPQPDDLVVDQANHTTPTRSPVPHRHQQEPCGPRPRGPASRETASAPEVRIPNLVRTTAPASGEQPRPLSAAPEAVETHQPSLTQQTSAGESTAAGSIAIPHVSEERSLDQIKKLLKQKQAQKKPAPEISSLEFAKQTSSQINSDAAQLEGSNPNELLAALRAKRAIETDPLANLTSPPSRPSHSSHSSEGSSIEFQISQIQQAIEKVEPDKQTQAASYDPYTNPFLRKTRSQSTATSIPEQVKSLSDSILGLVQTAELRAYPPRGQTL